ncbi:MAG: hypothetical protein H0V51_01450 [Chloroflexi bacterium]|nr:hypothetical protein [Chloroflexota bacterium]
MAEQTHRPPTTEQGGPAEAPPALADSRPPVGRRRSIVNWLWLAGALLFTALFAARTMAPALAPGTVQDDARQHVFWMLRFRDPELFRGDLIADYFQWLAPPAYRALYAALSWMVDPFLASKLVSPILGGITALFTFLLVRRLHPAPTAAFLGTVLLSWYVWQYDDLASASPRAFLLPMLAAQVWAIVAGRLVLAVGLTVLGALFYPTAGALGVALLAARLVHFRRGSRRGGSRTAPAEQRADWLAFLVAAALVALALLPTVFGATPYGPTVSASEARTMPEFGEGGRNTFFYRDPYRYWLEGYRGGLDLRVRDQLTGLPILFEYAALAALLPMLLLFRPRLADVALLSGRSRVLLHLLVASFGLFLLAHLLLFRLYLPSRYVQWSLPLVFAVAAGLALGIVIEALAERLAPTRPAWLSAGLALALGLGLALYPASYDGNFVPDRHPEVWAYLRDLPTDTLVAAVPTEADSVPALTGRRVLVAREYALAYHLGYYGELRQRTEELIDAYYADSPRRLVELAERYGVDVFLVNRAAFDQATYADAWAGEFAPFTSAVGDKLRRHDRFALLDLVRRCAAVDDGQVAALPTACIASAR